MYDCIVVGGGPAGLTCSIYLARFNRSVFLIEDFKQRNYASQGIHGYLGYDGIKPKHLLNKARIEATKYGVKFHKGTVTKIIKKKAFFVISTATQNFKSKKLMLAYGVRDQFPQIKDFDKYYGKSIHHCPVCDGFEIINKKVGVIGVGKKASGMALELMQWTDQIIVLSNGNKLNITKDKRRKLIKNRIKINEEQIIKLQGSAKQLNSIVLESGKKIEIHSIFFTIDVKNSCTLAEDLRCKIEKTNNKIRVNKYGESSIKGVFAGGDLNTGPQLVVTACADGAVAAIQINKQLLKESLL